MYNKLIDNYERCKMGYHLAIPYDRGLCCNIHVKELTGYRIIEAKHEGHVTVLITERGGNFWRFVLFFDKSFYKYSVWVEQLNNLCALNFIALPNGLNIIIDDEKIILFRDEKNKREIKDSLLNSSTKLYHHGMTVYFSDGSNFYQIKMN